MDRAARLVTIMCPFGHFGAAKEIVGGLPNAATVVLVLVVVAAPVVLLVLVAAVVPVVAPKVPKPGGGLPNAAPEAATLVLVVVAAPVVLLVQVAAVALVVAVAAVVVEADAAPNAAAVAGAVAGAVAASTAGPVSSLSVAAGGVFMPKSKFIWLWLFIGIELLRQYPPGL